MSRHKSYKNLSDRQTLNVPVHSDSRGSLFPSNNNQLPFSPKRSFVVYDVPNGETRGHHAHHKTEQILSCLSGKLKIVLKNPEGQTVEFALKKGQAIHQFPYEWAEITFESNGILHAICSTDYDEKDYIRDYTEFLSCRG